MTQTQVVDVHVCGRSLGVASGPMALREFEPEETAFAGTGLTYRFLPMPAGWNEMDVVGGINAALNAVSDVTPSRSPRSPTRRTSRSRSPTSWPRS